MFASKLTGALIRKACRGSQSRKGSKGIAMMATSKPMIHLVLDFDGTITTEDTTAVIGGRCLDKAAKMANPELPSDQLPKDMSYYSDCYFQQYKQWQESAASVGSSRETVDDEVKYLSESRQVELNSFLRVRDAVLSVPGGIRDLEHDESSRNKFMMQAGYEAVRSGEVKIRDHEALKAIINHSDTGRNRWGVVSVSWSRMFILGVLTESGLLAKGKVDDFVKNVKANELLQPLPTDEQGGPDIICSALDKEMAFEKLLREWYIHDPERDTNSDLGKTVYIGDSSTDLGCLAQASRGLYICKTNGPDSFVQSLGKFSVRIRSLNEPPKQQSSTLTYKSEEHKPSIYLIKGFEEVHAYLTSDG